MSETKLRPGIWGSLELRAGEPQAAERPDLWAKLTHAADLTELRPKLAEDVEIREFQVGRGRDYAMIANPRDVIVYRLEPHEVHIVRLMDGSRTVKEIVLERLQESGDLELSEVVELVRQLYAGNFLDRHYVDVDNVLKRALDPVTAGRARARQFAKSLSIDFKSADKPVRWMYNHGLKRFFTKPAQIVLLLLSAGGIAAFVRVVQSKQFSLTGSSLAFGVLILMGLNYFLTFAHEVGHASVLIHNGRRVRSAGFMIYFGSPAFYVDSADGLLMGRRQRLIQAAAGIYAELILAGTASIVAWAFPAWFLSQTLYQFAVLNYVVMFMNLVPLLELDGYYLLEDLIQEPGLRANALTFIRHDIWPKLRRREKFSRRELGLATFGYLGIAFTIFSLYTSYFFWKAIFGKLVSRLWNGGIVTRVILIALAVIFAGPIIRGAIKLMQSVGRRLRAQWRRFRFRFEMKWRVEAAELIDQLPIFEDVPVDVLNDLAGRVRLRTLGTGQPLFRQGDSADAFYVVRRGSVQVVEEDSETGNHRILATLGRGQSFGELALVRESKRTATVRAAEESELFEIDKPTFDRLLSDMIQVPDFAPTLQQGAELREIPCFAHLESDQIADLLEQGEWVQFAPGDILMEQGEPGDAFYAIASGQVRVIKDGKQVAIMGPGSYAGEIALLFDVPRTATVAAYTPVRAYRLGREGFQRLIANSFRKGTLRPNVAVGRTMEH